MILQFLDDTHLEMEKIPPSGIRIKSRKATLSDCHCFLRPGVDICVLSNSECNDDDDSDQCIIYPVWLDAKINSIKRKLHGSGCSCEYYVNIYATQGSLGVRQRTLSKNVIVVGIDQICILQRLDDNCIQDQSYQWHLAEDCSSTSETKLLKGKFFIDISWLANISVKKQVSFYARSVNNKIVYQELGNDDSPSIRPEVGLLPSIIPYEKHRKSRSKKSIVVLALPAYNSNRPWPF
ncbi:hypothetical protein SESBI_12873 [Sesbania bispinosa]|nr:hypothetical protein SESBI_12873 [Sesbania bispinosa]